MEKKAVKWRRAEELRGFANALECLSVGTSDERAERIAWILNAADWLDPLVRKYWPVVDFERQNNDR
jgi:hypothetical protein